MRRLGCLLVFLFLVLAGCMGNDLPVDGVEEPDTLAAEEMDDPFHLVHVYGEENLTVEAGPTPATVQCRPGKQARDASMVHHVLPEQQRLLHNPGHDLEETRVLFAFDLVRMPGGCPLLHALYPDPLGSVPITVGAGGEHLFSWEDGIVVVDGIPVAAGSGQDFHYNHTVEHGESVLHYSGWFRVENHGAWPRDSLVSE